MRKYIFLVALCLWASSCKKIQAGGNKGILKREPGTEEYDVNATVFERDSPDGKR